MSLHPALLAGFVMILALPALAQPAPPAARPGPGSQGPGALFARVDANGDGRVVFEEVWSFAQARFGEADRNRDGALVLEEALAFRPMPRPDGAPADANPMRARMAAAIFRAVDANSDGRVTLEEVRPALEAQFRALDVNGDRGVTLDELPLPRPAMHHRHPAGGASPHRTPLPGSPMPGSPMPGGATPGDRGMAQPPR